MIHLAKVRGVWRAPSLCEPTADDVIAATEPTREDVLAAERDASPILDAAEAPRSA